MTITSTIKQAFGANSPITIALNSLADTAGVLSSEVDKSSDLDLKEIFEARLNGAGTGSVDFYILERNANTGVYPSEDTSGNLTFLFSVDMSGTTPGKNKRIQEVPEFYKIYAENNSGAATGGSNNTLYRKSANLTTNA